MTSRSQLLGALLRTPPSYMVFVVLLVTLWVMRPNMMNIAILGTFARQVVPLGIVVLGQLLVISSRSIDLSAGGIILLLNYLISSGLLYSWGFAPVVLLCLGVGLVVGLFNGLLVGKRRASAVIVTLAVNIVLIGLVEYLANGKPPGDVPTYFRDLYNTIGASSLRSHRLMADMRSRPLILAATTARGTCRLAMVNGSSRCST